MDVVSVVFLAAVSAGILLYALALPQGGWKWWALALPVLALAIAGMAVGEGWLGVALLDAAEFLAIALVYSGGRPEAKAAARKYLFAALPALVLSVAGLLLLESGAASASPEGKIAVACLAVGFCLKLALIPFYFWLPDVVEHSPAMTAAIVVSVVDIASFSELAQLRSSFPWVFADHSGLWMALALASMLGGALLAIAQTSLRRMLAFSTIDDMGYLLLGVAIGGELGLSGAMLAALSHSLCKLILFGSVGVAEAGTGKPIDFGARGLASRFPVAGAAFIAGAIGFLGVPPAFGFVGRWRLYAAGAQAGGWALLGAMILASALSLLYYVRAIHRVWLGPAEGGEARAAKGGRGLKLASALLVLLVVAVIALGVNPDGIIAAEGPFSALSAVIGR